MAVQTGTYKVALTAATDTTAGGVLSLANPEGVALLVQLVLDITTPSSGAATVDAGIAANGTTSSDTLIDGASVATAAKVLSSAGDAGTNGKAWRKWGTTQYVTITASATTAGMVGSAHLIYKRA